MLTTFRTRLIHALWPVLTGLLLALGLLLSLMGALSLDAIPTAILVCVITSAFCLLAEMGGKMRWAVLGLGAALAVMYLMVGSAMRSMGGMLRTLPFIFQFNVEPLRLYAEEAAVFFGVLFSVMCWFIARSSAGFYPALSLMMAAILIIWFADGQSGYWYLLPALAALCMLFSRSVNAETPFSRVAPMAALVVLVAALVSPLLQVTSPRMEEMAENIRTFLLNIVSENEERQVYSIEIDGYKPLGNRLGGPVNINERPVMTVETEDNLLLRGVAFNHYTGLNWADTMSKVGYLYDMPIYAGTRADVFDENRPVVELRNHAVFTTKSARVTMQSVSSTTLFVPLRFENLETPVTLRPRFQQSSEVFIIHGLEAGGSYAFETPNIQATDPRLPALLEQATLQGERRDMAKYLNIPDAVYQGVYMITEEVVAGLETPLEKALAIREYLRTGFRYTLTPAVPPENQDFVSYFLMTGKEGYCTYFATAMAVMGRIAGLPTRYVEGYLAEPSGGTAYVTGKNAHAWAEVYFEGFGWVAFDATPPQSLGGPSPEDGQGTPDDGQGGEEPSGEESRSPDEGEDGPDSTPSPSPDPDQQDENEQGNENSPEGDESEGDESDEQEPTPSPSPSPESEDEREDESTQEPEEGGDPSAGGADDPEDEGRSRLWLLILLLLLLAALIAARVYFTLPDTVIKRRMKTDDERLLVWYRCLLGLLAAAGFAAKPSESPVAHALRVEPSLPGDHGLLSVADAVMMLGYGRYGASPAQVEEARACYRKLFAELPIKAKVVWFLRRTVKGIGSVKQVP